MKMFSDCIENSTAHGLPQLKQSENNRFTKLVWLLIILGSSATFLFHSASLLGKYLRHDTAVSVNLDSVDFVVPDVYICNTQPISKALIVDNIESKNVDYLELANYFFKEENLNELFRLLAFGQTRYKSSFEYDSLICNRNFQDFIQGGLENRRDKPSLQKANRTYIPVEEIFQRVSHHERYACYKLNDKYKSLIFRSYTLKFKLYTDENWFVNSSTIEELGPNDPRLIFYHMDDLQYSIMGSHVVYLTPPGQYPHSNSLQFDLGKGKSTSLSISMSYYKRVNQEKSPCSSTYRRIDYYDHLTGNKISYNATPMDCAINLYQRFLSKQSECVSALLPLPYELFSSGLVPFCSFTENDMLEVNSKIESLLLFDERYVECRNYFVCNLPVYSVVSSMKELTGLRNSLDLEGWFSGAWRLSNAMNNFVKPNEEEEVFDWEIDEMIKTSINEVYFHAPKVRSTLYEESLAYELKSLLSDVGGILGFYLGISLVTILEFVGYAVKHGTSGKSSNKSSNNVVVEMDEMKT